jgi:hypothetical protein
MIHGTQHPAPSTRYLLAMYTVHGSRDGIHEADAADARKRRLLNFRFPMPTTLRACLPRCLASVWVLS